MFGIELDLRRRPSGNLFSLDLLTDSEEGKQMDVKSPRLALLVSEGLLLCAIYGIVFPLVARLKWEASTTEPRRPYPSTQD